MARPAEKASLDQWYVIDIAAEIPAEAKPNRLLGRDLVVSRDATGTVVVREKLEGGALGEPLPTRHRYGFIWTTLGTPERELFDIPEADEPDRRHVVCGAVAVRASGLRIVENFLDMAHFPFVHTDILGAEPHTEVRHYTTEIRRDVDEVWATNCEFFQPQAALSASGGIMTQYM
ncbi:MAG TPA: aromatic ring-hydroxylating dioxygenase subunit alpha, partial [Kaistia sp.]|nr:aromatic ring-hydroxylating dioxygenase subunit alpha [Kaistia sp.]